jgi:hypothetical protein
MRSARVLWKNCLLLLSGFVIAFGLSELMVRTFISVRDVGPSFTTYDAVYGTTLKKNFSAQRITLEFTMRLSTNSDGFRGPELGVLSSRPILLLGDSFTMGYGVNRNVAKRNRQQMVFGVGVFLPLRGDMSETLQLRFVS